MPEETTENLYETERYVAEYLLFHFGNGKEILPWPFGPSDSIDYPVRVVTEALDLSRLGPESRALDVGCAVGRTVFELSRYCGEAIGIDSSQRFIEAARKVATGGLDYQIKVEGKRMEHARATLPAGANRDRCLFEQGDACDLRSDLGSFDVVLAINLICRLPDPMRFLERLPRLVKPGGQLVINTPCSWLEEYTPEEAWLGGRPEQNTFQGLRQALEPYFELKDTANMPFLIREHARKFQWTVAQSTRWQRAG
jgi:putative 4-mercaptohistidine N1-methyltranferase